jgi:cell wall-associated NlpC family hydrolase
MQRGSSGTTGSVSKTETTHSRKDPVFIDNISIRSDKTQHSSNRTVYSAPSLAKESKLAPVGSVELLLPQQFRYAILLDMTVEEIAASRMIGYIESWYGTPYRFGGTDKTGVDCSSFVQTFMQNIYSVSLPRTSAEQYQQSQRIKRKELEEGDLVFFTTRGKKIGVSHVGVYLRNNKFVHAATSGGVVISDLEEQYYSQHYSGAGRVK